MLLLLALACSSPVPDAPAPATPAPPPASAEPLAAATVAEAPPAALTDDECRAQGGRIITQDTYAHLDRRRRPGEVRTPFRICRIAAPENGRSCTDAKDCGTGRCWCDGALSRPDPMDDPLLAPLDGTAATGICDDEPIGSGSWRCLVAGGKVVLHGIIVD